MDENLDSILIDFVLRCDTASTYHLLSKAWPSLEFSKQLVQALQENPGASAILVIEDLQLAANAGDSIGGSASVLNAFAQSSEQLKITILHPPKLQKPKQKSAKTSPPYAKLTTNLLLTSKIKATGRDDGSFSILSASNRFDQLGSGFTAELIEIFGDSSMYNSFLSFVKFKEDPRNTFETEETHVYSNLYDHKVWYLGRQDYRDPAFDFLTQLKNAVIKSHQPAKIRFAVTEWDNCRLKFAQELVAIQSKYELDLKVIVKDTNSTGMRVAKVLEKLPYGGFRIFPKRDSAQSMDFESNFLLLQGPFSLHEDGEITPTSLVIFFSEGLTEAALHQNDGIWLRIANETIFSQVEDHWNALWDKSSDTLFPYANFNQQAKICPLKTGF